MAVRRTTPTTTPAATPATFGPLLAGTDVVVMTVVVGWVSPGAVTTTVLACVTTDGSEAFVVEGAAAAAVDDCGLEEDTWLFEFEEPEVLSGL